MEPARQELAAAIDSTVFSKPICPIYQNVDAQPHTCPDEIKNNLILQLTAPVRWRQSVENMWNDGGREFVELGPGNVLQNMIKKMLPESKTNGYQ
jgi:[acyl-carrier-protein] S-malonyltransferase